MDLPELTEARLIKRYKRFLADVETSDGQLLTIHCPNTGAMTGCNTPGAPVWYSTSDNAKRKYPNTWELVETPQGLVSINTHRANALVHEALEQGVVAEVTGLQTLKAEVPAAVGEGRMDFHAQMADRELWIEVKSVTLHRGHEAIGAFPDAHSERALKHVNTLRALVESGHRAMLFFCCQHTGMDVVEIAADIDPAYASGVERALEAGVEVVAYGIECNLSTIKLSRRLDFSAPS